MLFLLLLAAITLAVFLQAYILHRIKRDAPDVYVSLGAPKPFFSDGGNLYFASGFILRRRYAQLISDPAIKRLCDCLLVLFVSSLLLLILVFVFWATESHGT